MPSLRQAHKGFRQPHGVNPARRVGGRCPQGLRPTPLCGDALSPDFTHYTLRRSQGGAARPQVLARRLRLRMCWTRLTGTYLELGLECHRCSRQSFGLCRRRVILSPPPTQLHRSEPTNERRARCPGPRRVHRAVRGCRLAGMPDPFDPPRGVARHRSGELAARRSSVRR